MPGLFRTPLALVFVDEDQRELGRVDDAQVVPAVGDNVQLRRRPYRVERVGYDIPAKEIERVFVVLVPV